MSDKETIRREAIKKTARTLREEQIRQGGKDPGADACERRVGDAMRLRERKDENSRR